MLQISMNSKTLKALLSEITVSGNSTLVSADLPEILVNKITSDSREVVAGDIFVAIKGSSFDGHTVIDDVVKKGAIAVIHENSCCFAERNERGAAVFYIAVQDSKLAFAKLAATWYGKPAEKMILVGVTGTNGKTTVTYLVEEVLKKAGIAVGVIGTINNRYWKQDGREVVLATRHTTPDAMTLQKVLAEMTDAGVQVVVMEVSSHALDQARVGGMEFSVAAFTNLSRDHLDYHRDMASYLKAKKLLFTNYFKHGGHGVIPYIDGQSGELAGLRELVQQKGDAISWGRKQGADILIGDIEPTLEYTRVGFTDRGSSFKLRSPLVGAYNVENSMVAYGICRQLGLESQFILEGLSQASGAPGRVQRISVEENWPVRGPVVFVDYAHTPDALEKVLTTVKEIPHGNLFCVVGCGGDRDGGKRSVMGGIAAELADVTVISDDNPRTEDPDEIVRQVLEGVYEKRVPVYDSGWLRRRAASDSGAVVIRDRREAIVRTVQNAVSGDIVVIAGKGHESYQITESGRRYFDDSKEAENGLLYWTPEIIAKAVSGEIFCEGESPRVLGKIITDSRQRVEAGVFVALAGRNHDAHGFVAQAVENGCQCVVVQKHIPGLPENIAQIVVSDTTCALGELAAFRRRSVGDCAGTLVVGITGSCGKTTVKEMTAAVLEAQWPPGEYNPEHAVLKTSGNFNNLIGLPLSLLPLDVNHRAAVLEMGMSVPGEIKRLAEIAIPDICCITNVHEAHLQGLESIEGVVRAKEELFAAAGSDSILVINLDDERVAALAGKYKQRKICYSLDADTAGVDVWSSSIDMRQWGGTVFQLNTRDDSARVSLPASGLHNVANALCAAAIGLAAGMALESIVRGLESFSGVDKRMQQIVASRGYSVINDTYNANPASMRAGLETLVQIARGQKIAILGDMLELGPEAGVAHYEIGKYLATLRLDAVYLLGDFKEDMARGALSGGLSKDQIHCFDDKKMLAARFLKECDAKTYTSDDVVFVKASRGLEFETIVEDIVS